MMTMQRQNSRPVLRRPWCINPESELYCLLLRQKKGITRDVMQLQYLSAKQMREVFLSLQGYDVDNLSILEAAKRRSQKAPRTVPVPFYHHQ